MVSHSILASKLGHHSPDEWLCKAVKDWLDSWAPRRLGVGCTLPGGQLQGARPPLTKGETPQGSFLGPVPIALAMT